MWTDARLAVALNIRPSCCQLSDRFHRKDAGNFLEEAVLVIGFVGIDFGDFVRVVVKMKVYIRRTPAFADSVKHDIRALLQVNFNIVVNFLRCPGPGGVVIPLFTVDPDLRVVIVRGGHDSFHILGRSHDDNTVSIDVIGGAAAVHIVTVRRIQFKDSPLAGTAVLLIPLHFNVLGLLQTGGGG